MELGDKQKGPRGLIFKDKHGNITEQYNDEDNNIAGVGPSNITGVEDQNQNHQNPTDVHID